MRFWSGASGLVGLLLKNWFSSSGVDAATIGRRRWSRNDRYAFIDREDGGVMGGAVAVVSHDVKLKSCGVVIVSHVVSIWSACDDVTRCGYCGQLVESRRRGGVESECWFVLGEDVPTD